MEKALVLGIILLANAATGYLFMADTSSGDASARYALPLDDAWIHLVYARNLARYGRFSYNGNQPEAGATSPLWAMVLAPAFAFGWDCILYAKLAGILFAAATAYVVYELLSAYAPPWWALFGAAAVSVEPNLSFYKVSGMDTTLFLFLLILSWYFFLRRRFGFCGAATGIAVLARPEGLITLGFFALAIVFTERNIKALARFILPALLIPTPWFLYCLSLTGNIFPTPFYIKTLPLALRANPFVKALWFILTSPDTLRGALLIVYALGVVRAVRRERPVALMLAFPLTYLAAICLKARFVTEFFFGYTTRYLLPVNIFLLVGAVYGLAWFPGRRTRLIAPAIAVALFSALIFANIGLAQTYSLNCKNFSDYVVTMGFWIKQHIPEGSKIGVDSAGAIQFIANEDNAFEIYDLDGLNSIALVKACGYHIDDACRMQFIREENISYVVATEGYYPGIESREELELVYAAETVRDSVAGGHPLNLYRIMDVDDKHA